METRCVQARIVDPFVACLRMVVCASRWWHLCDARVCTQRCRGRSRIACDARSFSRDLLQVHPDLVVFGHCDGSPGAVAASNCQTQSRLVASSIPGSLRSLLLPDMRLSDSARAPEIRGVDAAKSEETYARHGRWGCGHIRPALYMPVLRNDAFPRMQKMRWSPAFALARL